MSKGFTIFELLIIILVLSFLGTIALIGLFNTMHESRECKYEMMKEQILESAKIYVESNYELSEELSNYGYLDVKIGELQDAGFLEREITNPKTNQIVPSDYYINITKNIEDEIIYVFYEENYTY